MRRLWYGNFDFEASLASGGRPSSALRRLNAELASVWVAVASRGDLLWTPQPIEQEFFNGLAEAGLPRVTGIQDMAERNERLTLVPWAWTEATFQLAGRLSEPPAAKLPDAARTVNARSFSAALEAEWGCGLAKATSVRTLPELRTALRRFIAGEEWVVKADWSNAARERRRGSGPEPDERTLGWAEKRLRRDGCLHVEPWVARLEERGIQFEIHDDRSTDLVGGLPLLTDASGKYLGSQIRQQTATDWDAAIEIASRAAARAAAAGYVGPIGIDAMRYRDATGEVRVRSLQDVNARWTMGRLALGFRKLLGPQEAADWHHVRWHGDAAGWSDTVASRLPHAVRMLVTTPERVGGAPTDYGTALMISDDLEALAAAREIVLRR